MKMDGFRCLSGSGSGEEDNEPTKVESSVATEERESSVATEERSRRNDEGPNTEKFQASVSSGVRSLFVGRYLFLYEFGISFLVFVPLPAIKFQNF